MLRRNLGSGYPLLFGWSNYSQCQEFKSIYNELTKPNALLIASSQLCSLLLVQAFNFLLRNVYTVFIPLVTWLADHRSSQSMSHQSPMGWSLGQYTKAPSLASLANEVAPTSSSLALGHTGVREQLMLQFAGRLSGSAACLTPTLFPRICWMLRREMACTVSKAWRNPTGYRAPTCCPLSKLSTAWTLMADGRLLWPYQGIEVRPTACCIWCLLLVVNRFLLILSQFRRRDREIAIL